MLKFAIICAIFLLCALAYYRIHHEINIATDIIGTAKQDQLKVIKRWIQWAMIASGVLLLLCGYDLIYTEGAEKFLGSGCGCKKEIGIRDSMMPDRLSLSGMMSESPDMSGMMNPYELSEY
jgi:hypothetical protein